MREHPSDRAGLLVQLANLSPPPESVPINMLVKVKGTPLEHNEDLEAFDFIRTIAVACIMMRSSYVRLSAGREKMNEQTQALYFMAGANSIFYGSKLLTTANPSEDKDVKLFRQLGLNPQWTQLKTAPPEKIPVTTDSETSLLFAQPQEVEQREKESPLFYNAAI